MENHKLSKKPLYNLRKVLKETGIKADTLRAWERRYQLPNPSRTEGGHRLFSDYDIETIKWLLARQVEGMRISQAVQYWEELIAAGNDPLETVDQQGPPEPTPPGVSVPHESLSSLTRKWIDHSLVYNEEEAGQALDAAFTQYPWELVFTEMIFQGLSEIGERWYTGEISVQQEHFATELVSRKLSALISAAPPPYHPQKVLINCPPGEFHTISAMVIDILLRYRGWDVTYLGANVPNERLADALTTISPSLVIMTAARIMTSAALLETNRILQEHGIPLAFGGKAFNDIPGLAERIPGTYLGSDLNQAVKRIELLLSTPETDIQRDIKTSPYLDLRNEFQERLPALESRVIQAFSSGKPGDYSQNTLMDANRFLLQDTLAALTLGDIELLQYGFRWAEGLISARGHDPGDIKFYINTFLEVYQQELSDKAQPLLMSMKDYLETLE